MSGLRRIEWETIRAIDATVTAIQPALRGAVVPSAGRSAVERSVLAVGVPRTADAQTPKDDAIGLLQLAAEVEHELLVEYLYAMASIDASAGSDSRAARRKIRSIAIQEMGHLVAVQNLLLSIGGRDAHHLGRDRIRAASARNPLPFVLEQVRHASLAKYVAVESPELDSITDPAKRKRVQDLHQEAEVDAGFTPHSVVSLYAAIYWLFQPTDDPFGPVSLPAIFRPNWHLKQQDFIDVATIDRFGSTAAEWSGFPGLVLAVIHNANEACDLLSDIMVQGEGAAGSTVESHFSSFLTIVDSFEANRVMVLPLPRTPRVASQPPSEDSHATVLSHPYTDLWGRLFNIRYTHLILTIGHTFFLPTDDPDRSALATAALAMMTGLSGLIQQMMRLSVDDAGGVKAGPPFGLLDDTLPSDEALFWARHRAAHADEANGAAGIRTRPELGADAGGRDLLDQLQSDDQALGILISSHS